MSLTFLGPFLCENLLRVYGHASHEANASEQSDVRQCPHSYRQSMKIGMASNDSFCRRKNDGRIGVMDAPSRAMRSGRAGLLSVFKILSYEDFDAWNESLSSI